MACSVSGQDDRVLRSDWLPDRARWSYLARSGLNAVKNDPESHKINPLLSKFVLARKRIWPISSHLDLTLFKWFKGARSRYFKQFQH